MADTKISALPASTTPLAGTEVVPLVQSGTTKNVSVANLTAGRAVSAASVATTGNAQVGATASPFGSGYRALQVGGWGSFVGSTAGYEVYLTQNAYYDGSNWRGIGTDYAIMYGQYSGQHVFNCSSGGTSAGTAITWVPALTIAQNTNVTFNSGNLIQGTAAKGVNFTANTPAAGMTSQLLNWYEEGTWTPTDASGAGLTLTYTAAEMRYTRIGRNVFIQGRITYPSTASGATALIGGLPFTSSASNRAGLSMGYNNLTANYGMFVSIGSPFIELYTVASGGAQPTNANLSSATFMFSGTYTV